MQFRFHIKVDHFPITTHPEVYYSAYSKAIFQLQQVSIY